MKSLSKTKALKIAQGAVGRPYGSKTSWQVFGPHCNTNLAGPSTTYNYGSYQRAIQGRTRWVASIAATLMGIENADAKIYDHEPAPASVLLDFVIKA